MISVNKLSKAYGSLHAVRSVSFDVAAGEVLGFLGPNGAGKTTTMRMLAGFIAPDSGDAILGGHSVCREPLEVKKLIGYLPEGAPAYSEMTPLAFLKFIAAARGLGKREQQPAIDQQIHQLHLERVLHQPIHALSKGYKRRIGLAQALIHDPKILILDEPTDGLDPNQKHEVRELIAQFSQTKTIIISTHILSEVETICSRAIIIADGEIRADDSPAALIARSRYHNAVSVHVDRATTDIAGLAADIGALQNVSGTELNGDAITAFPATDSQILNDINDLLNQRRITPVALELERGRFDDVFREITAA